MADRSRGPKAVGSSALRSETYDLARPGHAERVYEILVAALRAPAGLERPRGRARNRSGDQTPPRPRRRSTGHARARPCARRRSCSRDRLGQSIVIASSTLEDGRARGSDFDLAVAASSFHWIDERVGLERIHTHSDRAAGALSGGRSSAKPNRNDPFLRAVDPLLEARAVEPVPSRRVRAALRTRRRGPGRARSKSPASRTWSSTVTALGPRPGTHRDSRDLSRRSRRSSARRTTTRERFSTRSLTSQTRVRRPDQRPLATSMYTARRPT